ncbi:NHL repeat-containing protein, partial [Candidatus Binatus sp.]|uniref:NHL repeat-containing protein n=1 Tax=Candidatus Binatus sp. TaxID=2811406 RepID=UPI003CC51BC6
MAVALAIAGTPGSPGDATADFELGQLDFVHNTQNFVTSASLSGSNQIAVDSHSSPNHLYVADSQNNRILGWNNATSFSNGHVPDVIIGQPDQYSTAPNQGGSATLSTLSAPSGLAVDSGSNLWVIDLSNSRLLEFPDPFTQVGTITASNSFAAPSAGFGIGLAFDSHNNLYLLEGNDTADEFNDGFSNLSTANLVLGTATSPGNTCPSFAPTAARLCLPSGITVDGSGTIEIADTSYNRVMVYQESNNPPTNSTASFEIGQPGFTTSSKGTTDNTLIDPTDVKVDSADNVYVADAGNNRVLQFDGPIAGNQPTANQVLGQHSSFTTGACDTGTAVGDQQGIGTDSLCFPASLAFDSSNNFYVADQNNRRVLRFNETATPLNNLLASNELGQIDMAHGSVNFANATSLSQPGKIAIDRGSSPQHLYVLDNDNNRVLGWNNADSFANGAPANLVIGQPDFYTTNCDSPQSQGGDNDPASGKNFGAPSASNLCIAMDGGLAVDSSHNLWVSDTGNSRVLRFPNPFTSGDSAGESADLVLGYSTFTAGAGNFATCATPTQSNFCWPAGLAFDRGGRLYAADDQDCRVLRFEPSFSSGMNAVQVFGAANSFT